MIILGIDPGTHRIGYGLIKKEGSSLSLLECGLLSINGKSEAERLGELNNELEKIIKKFSPDRAGVEKLFFSRNQTTAISVAQARGVILFTLNENKIPFFEYTPQEVKSAVSGYGGSDKKAVAKMVSLTLKSEKIKGFDDVSDALAIAITASNKKF